MEWSSGCRTWGAKRVSLHVGELVWKRARGKVPMGSTRRLNDMDPCSWSTTAPPAPTRRDIRAAGDPPPPGQLWVIPERKSAGGTVDFRSDCVLPV
jgi:hypothetical protein